MNDVSINQETRRGTIRFRLVPWMGIGVRIALFIILTTAGASLMFRVSGVVGAPIFLGGLALLMAHGASNARKSKNTKKDRWVVGTGQDIRKIERKVRQAQSLPSSLLDGLTLAGFFIALLVGGVCVAMNVYLLPEDTLNTHAFTIYFIQGAILFAVFFTAGAHSWEPEVIMRKKDLLIRERDRILDKWTSLGPVVSPMLLLDEGDADLVTPEDIKLFVTFQNAPKDFIGVQIQISFNMSQPYLYCVILSFDTFAPAVNYKPKGAERITYEKGKDKNTRYLVVRQTTTRESGYSTSGGEADHVVDVAMAAVSGILAAAGKAGLSGVMKERGSNER